MHNVIDSMRTVVVAALLVIDTLYLFWLDRRAGNVYR